MENIHTATSMFSYLGGGPELTHTVDRVLCPTPAAGLGLAKLIGDRASYYATIPAEVPPNHPTALVFGELVGRSAMGHLRYGAVMGGISDPEPVYEQLSLYNGAFFGGIIAKECSTQLRSGKMLPGFLHTLRPKTGGSIELTWRLIDVVEDHDSLLEPERQFVGDGIFDLGYVGLRMMPVKVERVFTPADTELALSTN